MKRVLKFGLLVLCAVVIFPLSACDGVEEDEETLQAEAVVRDYHLGLSNRDIETLKELQVERRQNVIYGQMIDGLNEVQLLSIKENLEEKEWFMHSGRGENYEPDNIRAFEVEAAFDYQEYASLYYQNGRQKRVYFVVRKEENSPWLIKDMVQF